MNEKDSKQRQALSEEDHNERKKLYRDLSKEMMGQLNFIPRQSALGDLYWNKMVYYTKPYKNLFMKRF